MDGLSTHLKGRPEVLPVSRSYLHVLRGVGDRHERHRFVPPRIERLAERRRVHDAELPEPHEQAPPHELEPLHHIRRLDMLPRRRDRSSG